MYQPCCLVPGCQGKLGKLRKKQLTKPQGTWNLLGRPVRALFFPCIFGTMSIRQQEGKMRGGGWKFSQSLLMVVVLPCSQELLSNQGVFRQQEAKSFPTACLAVNRWERNIIHRSMKEFHIGDRGCGKFWMIFHSNREWFQESIQTIWLKHSLF